MSVDDDEDTAVITDDGSFKSATRYGDFDDHLSEEEETYIYSDDDGTATTTSQEQEPRRKRVTFSTVEIREYNLQLGDHPFCEDGLPLTLDWDYNPETTFLDVGQYESGLRPRRLTYAERRLRLGSLEVIADAGTPSPPAPDDESFTLEELEYLDFCDDLLEDDSPPVDLEPLSFMEQA